MLTLPGLSAPKVLRDLAHRADRRRVGLARHAAGDQREQER
jgi:hypothetical protein